MARPRALALGAGPGIGGLAPATAWRWLAALGSLKLTLACIGALALGVAAVYRVGLPATWPVAAPLGLAALNLCAAIVTRPVFRRQVPLLVFHLALLALIVLVALGRLTHLKGTLELSAGIPFSGTLTDFEAGPWHPWHLDRLDFTNEGFTVAYAAGVRRANTYNRVSWRDAEGVRHAGVIGDQIPLVLGGYRFYTSYNKGFAPVFRWQPDDGRAPVLGTIHLPSYPIHEYRQSQEWTPPGAGYSLWTMLVFDEVILDPEQPSRFRLPERHHVVVRHGDTRVELVPGGEAHLPGGTLRYEGLRTWMGYNVFYDWTLPWLLAACAVAVLALLAHFWGKFTARAWLDPDERAEA